MSSSAKSSSSSGSKASTSSSTTSVEKEAMINPEFSALFLQAFDTTKDMIETRGYNSEPLVNMKADMNDFAAQAGQHEFVHIPCPSTKKDKGVFHLVYVCVEKPVRTQKIKAAVTALFGENTKVNFEGESFQVEEDEALIVVFSDWTNDSFENVMRNTYTQYNGARIHVTQIQLLLFPIMEHDLVPEHRKLTDAEFDYVKSEYHITEKTQLPSIHFTDPVARVIGLFPQDVCEIIRPSKTAGTYRYYRLCVL